MEIISAIAAKVAEYTFEPIGRPLRYLFYYKENVEELKTQIDELRRARDRLQRKVDKAIADGEEIEGAVNDWLAKVRNITEDSENFMREEEQANTECSCGARLLNLKQRHQLSRRATKIKPSVVAQIQEAENIKEISYCPRQRITVENEGYLEFATRDRILWDVIEALKDPNLGKVGVWGMGGLGKTMLAKQVARISKDQENLFTQVVFITVSQTPNHENIQRDILKGLGMDPSLQGCKDFEDRLQNRLSKEDKVLVIVDDVWDKFDLKGVGISFGNDKKGCKILVTSRYHHVLYNQMGIERNCKVGELVKDEAMSLFYRIVGDQDHDFRSLATEIVMECGGLPIAITAVASALKNKGYQVWKNALRDLRNSIPVNIDGVDQQVYTSIKLSYDFLRNKEAKSLLLLCSLFPEDADIDVEAELCSYGIGINLFQGVNTLEAARDRTSTLVRNLKDHSLLLDGEDVWCTGRLFVKLHDVVRDVVIFISSNSDDDHDRMHNIRNAVELEEYSTKRMLKGSKAISLYGIKDDQFPQTLENPELKLLRLIAEWDYRQSESLHQWDHFFGGLSKLLVLHLESISLRSFPTSSICFPFLNLQLLRLNRCKLGDISWIGELKNLKLLDLSFSDITELPAGIGNLNRLLSLKLGYCDSLKVIRPNVILRLTRLEELDLDESFKNWEAEGGDNASVDEVKSLTNLTNLNLVAPDINHIINPKDMFSERLERYNIILGHDENEREFCGITSRSLMLDLTNSRALKEHDFEVLLKTCESLYLRGLRSNVAFELLDNRGFPNLKQVSLGDSDHSDMPFFRGQARFSCPKIWNGELPSSRLCFQSLTTLKVSRCANLKGLIPSSMIGSDLVRLGTLMVDSCEAMEEIVCTEEYSAQDAKESSWMGIKISFPKLERLELNSLPNLKRFCAGDCVDFSSLLNLTINDCPKLGAFITNSMPSVEIENEDSSNAVDKLCLFDHNKAKFPKLLNLQQFYCPKMWYGELPSSRPSFDKFPSSRPGFDKFPSSGICFQSLTTLVSRRANVKGLIPSSLIGSDLVNLKTLTVYSCEAMEEIVFTEEYSAQDANASSSTGIKISFPKLEDLELNFLPNLKRFCAGDCVDFSSLLNLRINDCPKLGAFITNSMIENEDSSSSVDKQCLFDHNKVKFPKLQSISLSKSLNVEKIWNDDLLTWSRFDFQSLSDLYVSECDHLTSLIPSTASTGLIHLRSLRVYGCKAMKEIVFTNFVEEESSVNRIPFPELETLELEELPNLESFSFSEMQISGCEKLQLVKQKISLPTTTNVQLHNENLAGSMEYLQRPSHHKDVMKVDELSAETSCQLIGVVEGDDSHDASVFKTLGVAKLWSLPNLHQLPTLQNMETLCIAKLGRLKDLSTPSMLFRHLKVLSVVACHGLTTLLSLPAAKSLSRQLTRLSIIACKSLAQVIANDDDDDHDDKKANDEIIINFSQLESLVLDELWSLTSFYSAGNNHNNNIIVLEFPRLGRLVVGNCPVMKTFSPHGSINCPSLSGIILPDWRPVKVDIWQCEDVSVRYHGGNFVKLLKGDINSTFQKLREVERLYQVHIPKNSGGSTVEECDSQMRISNFRVRFPVRSNGRIKSMECFTSSA